MNDDIDRAQDQQLRDNDTAVLIARERIASSFRQRDASVDGICIDCDDPIEPARLKVLAGKTSRCASCARDHEQRIRGGR